MNIKIAAIIIPPAKTSRWAEPLRFLLWISGADSKFSLCITYCPIGILSFHYRQRCNFPVKGSSQNAFPSIFAQSLQMPVVFAKRHPRQKTDPGKAIYLPSTDGRWFAIFRPPARFALCTVLVPFCVV
jgi:hypothetical protein